MSDKPTYDGGPQPTHTDIAIKEHERLLKIEKLAGELIKPNRKQVSELQGGGVVMKCNQCQSDWWLDEPEPDHEPTCPAVKLRALLRWSDE